MIENLPEERIQQAADIQNAVAAFFARGGKAQVLPPPTFKPLPEHKSGQRNAIPKGRKARRTPVASVGLPKPVPATTSMRHSKQKAHYEQLRSRDEQAELIHRIKLKDQFRELESSLIERVIELARGNFTVRQITYRTRIGAPVVRSILSYHNVEVRAPIGRTASKKVSA